MGSDLGPSTTSLVSLDGEWLLGTDPDNVGRGQEWWLGPVPGAKPTRVPWIIQETFPGYHGVAWYWREFKVPDHPHQAGRYLLRFWMVDYLADVWVNDRSVGTHEGGEDPFTFDVTDAVHPDTLNRLAVRVLNPTEEPIDGIVLGQTPHRNKIHPHTPGRGFNYGGITDSVDLIVAPPVRIDDVFVRPDAETGDIRVQATVHNAMSAATSARIEFTAAPATSGETLDATEACQTVSPGVTSVDAALHVPTHRLWDLSDPYLYRVTVRVHAEHGNTFDELSTQCGFRTFRFEDGYFHLNGRRILLQACHTGNDTPIADRAGHDPELHRRDFLYAKAMGFNAVRVHIGVARRYQLDLADQIGMLVFDECFAAVCLEDSPEMPKRFDHATVGMVKRDRNHPSVVMWGLLNEESNTPIFQHAVSVLPMMRATDDTRIVMLNSGRFDGYADLDWDDPDAKRLATWRGGWESAPNVTYNRTEDVIELEGTRWALGQLSLRANPDGRYSVVRWRAPTSGTYVLSATFEGLGPGAAKSDVHLLHNGTPFFDGFINAHGHGNAAAHSGTVSAQQGDTIDAVVGVGVRDLGAGTTALELEMVSCDGRVDNAARDFSWRHDTDGVWAYGWLRADSEPDATTFTRYSVAPAEPGVYIGSLSNPGSNEWEDVLADLHCYGGVPHPESFIATLRGMSGGKESVFLSEYGSGCALDLARLARYYEQSRAEHTGDAQLFRGHLDAFLQDWERWDLADTFASPEDYFRQCLAKMAAGRALSLNAIRSNPRIVGHSLTAMLDHGWTGEGLHTLFRELKPGTVDAVFDGLASLRWCLFAEPTHAYSGTALRLEAVLANEDVLPPGEHTATLAVVRPDNEHVFERRVTVTIPDRGHEPAPRFALPVFSEDVFVEGPTGKYRFLAVFEEGAAAAGGQAEFHLTDAADMPTVDTEVALWGHDPQLEEWLTEHDVAYRRCSSRERGVILVSGRPIGEAAMAFEDLRQHILDGATAVCLSPSVFRAEDDPLGWLPLESKGALSWLARAPYPADEWAKRHPIFDGLPCGGLMSHAFYRDLIPGQGWTGQDDPSEVVAGAINTSQGYSSGLLVAVHDVGAGRLILNALRIRENLGADPTAERLLRNMVRYAAQDRPV